MEYAYARRTLVVLFLTSVSVSLSSSTPLPAGIGVDAGTDSDADQQQLSSCQIFELPKYEGEFLHLENRQEIPNLLHLIESKWRNSTKRHSIKLFGTCQLYGCTEERFAGLCKTFNATRKVVLQNRIVSVQCRCADIIIVYKNQDDLAIASTNDQNLESGRVPSSGTECGQPIDASETNFENFARFGKKIIGVARNYPWNRTSLAQSVEPSTKPLIFLKPTTSYLLEGEPIRIPKDVGKIYYEVELGVVIGKKTSRISEENALDAVAGYFLALDLTAKDLLRVYHDAMYEDEYTGSTQSDHDCCCRTRGLSALACWFLSVLILLGLAASIILTVFFVFRSRTFIGKATESGTIITSMEDELQRVGTTTLSNILANDFDHTFNGGASTRQTTLKYDDTAREESSSEVHDFVVPSPKTVLPYPYPTAAAGVGTATTTTRRPSSSGEQRHHLHAISPVINYKSVVVQNHNPVMSSSPSPSPAPSGSGSATSTVTSRKAYHDLVRSTTPHTYNYGLSSSAPPRSSTTKDLLDLQSSLSSTTSRSAMIKLIMDTMTKLRTKDSDADDSATTASVEDGVFPSTLSKDVIEKLKALSKKQQQRKNIQDNIERYDQDDDNSSDENLEKLIATIIASGSSSAEQKRRRVQQTPSTTPVNDFFDEYIGLSPKKKSTSSLSKEDFRIFDTTTPTITSSASTSTPHYSSASRGDLLTRIIKNLAPRFKGKTEKPFAAAAGSTTDSYSSAEKRARWATSTAKDTIKTLSSTTTTKPNPNVIIITPTVIIPSSGAGAGSASAASSEHRRTNGLEVIKAPTLSKPPSPEQEVLDILVSSQDSKTMITKQTEDGLVTSVILPPWYVNDTYDDYRPSTTHRGLEIGSGSGSSKGENTTIIIYPNEDSGDGGGDSRETTTYSPPSLGNFFRNLFFNTDRSTNTKKPSRLDDKGERERDSATIKPLIIRRIKSTTPKSPLTSPASGIRTPLNLRPANNGFHQVSSDGKANIYGYYPDSDEILQYSDSKRIPIPNPTSGERVAESGTNKSPSHVIDIEIDRKVHPEIIVDNSEEDQEEEELEDAHHNDGDFLYGRYGQRHDHVMAGSSIRPQILAPPPGMNVEPTGGGIRHPVSMLTTGKGDTIVAADSSTPSPSNETGSSNLDGSALVTTPMGHYQSTTTLTTSVNEQAVSSDQDQDLDQAVPLGIQMSGSSSEAAELSRRPVQELDVKLYPFSQIVKPRPADSQEELGSSQSQERRKKAKPTTTTESSSKQQDSDEITTRRQVYEVYAVKYTTTPKPPKPVVKRKNKNSKEEPSSSEETRSNFAPPELINFHSNTLKFSPVLTTGGFLPSGDLAGEKWRPVTHEQDREYQQNIHQVRTSTPAVPGPKVMKRPMKHSFFNVGDDNEKQASSGGSSSGADRNALAASSMWLQTTEAPPSLSPPPPQSQPQNAQKPAKLPIRPSQPIPPPPTPPMQQHQHQFHHQYGHHYPHDHVVHHQNPNVFASNNHLHIDRSKYLHRPAPPPILMRRTPQQQGALASLPPHFGDMQAVRKVSTPNYPPQYLSNQQQLLRQQQQLHQHMTRMKTAQQQQNQQHRDVNWPANNEFQTNQQQPHNFHRRPG